MFRPRTLPNPFRYHSRPNQTRLNDVKIEGDHDGNLIHPLTARAKTGRKPRIDPKTVKKSHKSSGMKRLKRPKPVELLESTTETSLDIDRDPEARLVMLHLLDLCHNLPRGILLPHRQPLSTGNQQTGILAIRGGLAMTARILGLGYTMNGPTDLDGKTPHMAMIDEGYNTSTVNPPERVSITVQTQKVRKLYMANTGVTMIATARSAMIK